MNIFLDRYEQLGQDVDPSIIVLPQTIRINTLKIAADELIERLKREDVELVKVPYLDFGYEVKSSRFSLGAAPEYLQGYYYIQESAAQVPVQVLRPTKKDTVLDMSAAPGGKTTQIAQYMENEGVIVALDSSQQRLLTLRHNLERLGITNVIVYQKDAQYVSDFNMKFDKILLDAPCSGNFCIDKAWFDKRDLENLKTVSKLQKQLLNAAADVLNDGGELVYSTCSLEPEEDEMVVDWFLKERPEIRIENTNLNEGDPGITNPFGIQLNKDVMFCRRFWPNKTKTQGFFIAKFRKVAEKDKK